MLRTSAGTPKAGSPPHMRGTVGAFPFQYLLEGITPAHAGNSSECARQCSLSWDHPRTCGEQILSHLYHLSFVGSPPHMRGTDSETLPVAKKYRITPAHAGNRSPGINTQEGEKDHPRTCGEQRVFPYRFNFLLGSPPHMRGTEFSTRGIAQLLRITPAHAGNSVKPVAKRH